MVQARLRHMFVRPVPKMDQRAWTECHGPAGVGVGHVAQALAHLAGGRADRTWDMTWLEGLQLSLFVSRADVLDAPRAPPRRPRNLDRGRTRPGLRRPDIRHQPTPRTIVSARIRIRKSETSGSARRSPREPAIMSQVKFWRDEGVAPPIALRAAQQWLRRALPTRSWRRGSRT
jgi:hypothetical protein